MSPVPVTPIRTKQDYQNALRRIDELLSMNPAPYSELDDELDVINTLVHAY
jgi:HTH-type transcriptional regulator/antitoxin HigA